MNVGRVLCVLGREVLVEEDGVLVRATPAGRLKIRGSRELPVAGDLVRLGGHSASSRTVTGIEPRRSAFTKVDFQGKPVPVVANVERLVVVISTAEPEPSLGTLDRFLVLGERGGLRCAVCLNKVDLAQSGPDEIGVYPEIGYPVVRTSAKDRTGLEGLRALLEGRVSAFVGPSGTGKSSLINELLDTRAQEVREVSARIGRGRHTTTLSRLLPMECGGYITDTPGIGWLGMPDGSIKEIAECFPEFGPHAMRCRFTDCVHRAEPGCAVKEAVDAGLIARHRHASYLALIEEIDRPDWAVYWRS
ncbi:ribosome small subunit-dependent GTPase A [Candidatus Fermentibacteria bacterium]|nr:ribosome small subunit-dependent GTPase A [Candidatus Fermentibacteria bacterium]